MDFSKSNILRGENQNLFRGIVLAAVLFMFCVSNPGHASAPNISSACSISVAASTIGIASNKAGRDVAKALSPKEIKEIQKPPTRAELQEIITAFQELPLKDRSGYRIRGFPKTFRLSPARFEVLMNDLRVLVLAVNARSLQKRLATGNAGLHHNSISAGVKSILLCGEQRFAGRGGPEVFESSIDLVETLHEQLAPVIVNTMQWNARGLFSPGDPRLDSLK